MTDYELLPDNPQVLKEARDWLSDCFEPEELPFGDDLSKYSVAQLSRCLQQAYDGGIEDFLTCIEYLP